MRSEEATVQLPRPLVPMLTSSTGSEVSTTVYDVVVSESP